MAIEDRRIVTLHPFGSRPGNIRARLAKYESSDVEMVLNFPGLNGRKQKVAASGRITGKFIHSSADPSAKVMANMMDPPIWSYT